VLIVATAFAILLVYVVAPIRGLVGQQTG